MKLEKFKKNKKVRNTLLTLGIASTILGGGIILYRSYALYQESKSYDVLQGIIPEFGDIELAYTVDGENLPDSFPTKESGYIGKEVKCNEGVTAEWNNITWTLSDIKVENKKRIICTVNFSTDTSEATLAEKAKLGDYVDMTPTATSFTIPGSLTGCAEEGSNCNIPSSNGDQTINPSELTTWRIINIKEDGTIEMISENVSSAEVYFYGKTGYKNFVGTLNMISGAYENSAYTIDARAMGYNGQTEFITDTSTYLEEWPYQESTKDNSNESVGGGDMGYLMDVALVRTAIGKIRASKKLDVNASEYYLASREFHFQTGYCQRFVGSSYEGGIGFHVLIHPDGLAAKGHTIRPIVILKSDLEETGGTGEMNSPWKLS